MPTMDLMVKRGEASKRNWNALQQEAGFYRPDDKRKQFMLTIDPADRGRWEAEIADHGAESEVTR